MKKQIIILLSILFLFSFFSSSVFSEVSHPAEQIKPGVFGGDFDPGNFSFNGNVSVNGSLNVSSKAFFDSYVGIGTYNPVYPLDVVSGSIRTNNIILSTGGVTVPSSSFYVSIGETTIFFIDSSTNNIGIGTVSPSDKLTVVGDVRVFGTGGNYPEVRFWGDTSGVNNYTIGSNLDGGFFIYDASASSTRFLIDSSGNIGIGVLPGEKLHVNGNVRVSQNSRFISYLMNFQSAPSVDNSYARGSIGQFYWNSSDSSWYLLGNGGSDTSGILFSNGGDIVFIQKSGLSLPDNVTDSTLRSYATVSFDVGGNVTFSGDLLPRVNNTYSLGSPDLMWKDIYVSSGTIYLGGKPLSLDSDGNLLFDGNQVETNVTPSLWTNSSGNAVYLDGNVGIGNSSPSKPLSVNGGAYFIGGEFDLYPGGSGVYKNVSFIDLNTPLANDVSYWRIMTGYYNNASDESFQIWMMNSSTTREYFTIDPSGNVGIGTSTFSNDDFILQIKGGKERRFYYSSNTDLDDHLTPRCSCDIDSTVEDCPSYWVTSDAVGTVCYDQFGSGTLLSPYKSNEFTVTSYDSGDTAISKYGAIFIGNLSSLDKYVNRSDYALYIDTYYLKYGSNSGIKGIYVYTNASYGIYSIAVSYGVYGKGSYGVYGSGSSRGVYGSASSSSYAYGVTGYGYTTSTSYNSYGVYGSAYSGANSYGVYGRGASYGVYGESTATGGYGVYCTGDYCGGTQAWTSSSDVRVKDDVVSLKDYVSGSSVSGDKGSVTGFNVVGFVSKSFDNNVSSGVVSSSNSSSVLSKVLSVSPIVYKKDLKKLSELKFLNKLYFVSKDNSSFKKFLIENGLWNKLNDVPRDEWDPSWVDVLLNDEEFVSFVFSSSVFSLDELSFFNSSSVNGDVEVGFSAQELKDVFPEVVVWDNASGTYGITYSELIPYLFEAIKELKEEVDVLKQQVNSDTVVVSNGSYKNIVFENNCSIVKTNTGLSIKC